MKSTTTNFGPKSSICTHKVLKKSIQSEKIQISMNLSKMTQSLLR